MGSCSCGFYAKLWGLSLIAQAPVPVPVGFGTAPRTLPVAYNLAQFQFIDTTQGGWTAGGNGSPVYLQYTSWTNTGIVIDGFGTQYGGQYTVAGGDDVAIFIQNSGGPEFTIWRGNLP